MSRKVAIEIRNLSKTFHIKVDTKYSLKSLFASFFNQGKTKKFKAVNNLNLTVYEGEFFGVVGGNGSGKSTLLKLIAQIYEGDKGSKIIHAGSIVPFLELGVGFNPELTGKENIYLNGTILGMTADYLHKKFNEIVEFAEIKEFIDMPVKNYSSGMMLKLAFSIAIQAKADIYLLDEILSVGDENFQKKSRKEIIRLQEEGKTIIFVTHDLNAILNFCDRAMLLSHGSIELVGPPSDVIQVYRSKQQIKYSEDSIPPANKNSKILLNGHPINIPFTPPKRWGTGDIFVTTCELVDRDLKKISVITEDIDINLVIGLSVKEPKHDYIVAGFGLYRSDGLNIFGTNSDNAKLTISGKTENKVQFTISSNRLLDGDYFFNFTVYDDNNKETLDYISELVFFRVNTMSKDKGVAKLDYKISVIS